MSPLELVLDLAIGMDPRWVGLCTNREQGLDYCLGFHVLRPGVARYGQNRSAWLGLSSRDISNAALSTISLDADFVRYKAGHRG